MFGLMKKSTHEALIADAKDALGYGRTLSWSFGQIAHDVKTKLKAAKDARDSCNTRAATAEAMVKTLTAANEALEARIAELKQPMPLPKRKPVGKSSPVKEAAEVPVKGKVKA